MNKIRVAFLLNLTNSWLGGINYFKNLLLLINENRLYNIEPIVFIPNNANINLLKDYPDIKVIKTKLLNTKSFCNKFGELTIKLLHKNYFLERLLKKYNIDIISHILGLVYLKDFPTIGWIPDFQHKHLPEFFSKNELISRTKTFKEMGDLYDCILLSSNDAKNDMNNYYHDYIQKAQVFQFVTLPKIIKYDKKILYQKYNIKTQFFFIPNQFWQHKNHKLVLEALNILSPTKIKIYCSGNIHDYRNKDYLNMLLKYIKDNNLEQNFIILGQIPYEDVQALMLESKAVINPSLFEGWSTSVEEAKTFGKRIILSDINVHKEQKPRGGIFFSKKDAKDLARVMYKIWNENESINNDLLQSAKSDLEDRKKVAIEKYREILEFAIKKHEQH